MAYLVTGATGTLGREVVQALLNNHQTVKSASRHPESNKMIEKKTPRLVYLSSHG